MASTNTTTTSPQPEPPIQLTPMRRSTLRPSSSSSLSSSDPVSNPSSSSSMSPPRTPNTASTFPCSPQSTSQPPTSIPEPPPAHSQDPFADSSEGAVVSAANTQSSAVTVVTPDQNSAPQEQRAWWGTITSRLSQGTWLQNTIGMAGLAVALVALFVYAYRGYKMDKFENLMALYQACASLRQVSSERFGCVTGANPRLRSTLLEEQDVTVFFQINPQTGRTANAE
ncbi:MAG: hypothetical protein Q9191_006181 [Dirinaria sp. TL-2023a]